MNAVASRNVKFISHSDQGGRGDGVQIMVHRGYAYIGRSSRPKSISVGPSRTKPVTGVSSPSSSDGLARRRTP
jgi:hypothetical protein